jgi:hypothetical protein
LPDFCENRVPQLRKAHRKEPRNTISDGNGVATLITRDNNSIASAITTRVLVPEWSSGHRYGNTFRMTKSACCRLTDLVEVILGLLAIKFS